MTKPTRPATSDGSNSPASKSASSKEICVALALSCLTLVGVGWLSLAAGKSAPEALLNALAGFTSALYLFDQYVARK
ncbi:hypothetical protein [Streptosporangium sp. LJ11]|uniref:hypothetical protein n=1 Tax=Streptosporangium sp. LJ11 TaxID=3436927 RepID=UPI003F79A960